jgi:hypothetical protein
MLNTFDKGSGSMLQKWEVEFYEQVINTAEFNASLLTDLYQLA